MSELYPYRWIYIGCLSVLLITAASCGLFDSDSSHSTDIVWQEEDLDDFVLYAFGGSDSNLVVIDVPTGEILKRITHFKGLQSAITNEDGTQLYVSTGEGHAGMNPGYIYKVNTSTWEYEVIYERAAHLLTNRRGGIYFITKEEDPETGLAVADRMFGKIDPSTGSVTELDSIYVDWGAWYDDRLIEIHPNKPLVFAVDGNNRLYRYDYDTGEIIYLFPGLSFQSFARIALSGSGESLFIPGGPVLDLTSEQIVGSIPVWRLGTAISRRDNNEVYITDPGGYLREPFSTGKVFILSPSENRIVDEIKAGATDRIQLTPKQRYAISNFRVWYVILDLKTRSRIDVFEYSGENYQSIEYFYLAPKPSGL